MTTLYIKILSEKDNIKKVLRLQFKYEKGGYNRSRGYYLYCQIEELENKGYYLITKFSPFEKTNFAAKLNDVARKSKKSEREALNVLIENKNFYKLLIKNRTGEDVDYQKIIENAKDFIENKKMVV